MRPTRSIVPLAPVLLAPVLLAALAPCGSAAQSPSRFATRVMQFTQGAGGGIFVPQNALGHPRGGGYFQGSLHVLSLGEGGSVTLGFDVALADGPGVDFIVSENPFLAAGTFQAFQQPAFVEVSTDGARFARFPNRYGGPAVPLGPYDPTPIGWYAGFAGCHPVLANDVASPGIDPVDLARAGGDGFDLADLGDHPLVRSGAVDLMDIRYVRIVDVVSGTDRDSSGRTIYAPRGGADIDAVTVVHHRGNLAPRGPVTALHFLPDRRMRLRIEDPDGLLDLDPGTLAASLLGITVPFETLLGIFDLLSADATGLTMATSFPIPPGLPFSLAASARDRSGALSSAVLISQ